MISVKHIVSLFLSLFILSHHLLAASGKGNNDYYTKVELEYLKGNYKAALETSDKYVKEVENLVGKNHFIYARLVFQNAKINEALGDYANYKKHILEAKRSLVQSDKKDVKSHAEALVAGADCFMEYGDYASAHELLLASKLLTKQKNSPQDEPHIDKVKLKYAEILLQEGFTIKALELTTTSLDYRNKRDVRKDVMLNEKTGSNAKTTLTTAERLVRKRDVAEAINLLIRIYISNGLYVQADSLVEETGEWVEAALGKKDLLYVKNMMLDGQLLEIGGETDLAADMYDKSMVSYKKIKSLKSKLPNRTKLEIFDKQIGATQFENEDRADNLRRKMYNEIASSYGEENSYMSRVKLSEAVAYFLEEKYVSADTMLRKLIANKKYYPTDNLAKAKAMDLLFDTQVRLQKFKDAEQTLQKLVAIKKKFYSPESPVLQLNYLDLANFKVAYSNDFKSADTIFTKGIKIIEAEVPPTYPVYFQYHYEYAKYLFYADRLDLAEKVLEDVCDKVRKQFGKKSREYMEALCKLSNAQTDNGNFAGALGNLNLATEAMEESPTPTEADRIRLVEQYIHYYTTIGDFEEVQTQAKKVKRIIKREKKFNLEYASAEEKNIELKINQGNYQDAGEDAEVLIKNYTQALGKDNKRLVNVLDLASRVSVVSGDYAKGEEYAQQSVDITKEVIGDNSLLHMQSLSHLMNIYMATGEYDMAEILANHIVDIYRGKLSSKHYLLAQALNNLGEVKLAKNIVSPSTEACFQEALVIIEASLGKAHPQYAEVLVNYAQLKIDLHDYANAEKYLKQAHQIYLTKFGEENTHTIHSFFMLGNLHTFRRNFDAAKKEFAHARSLTQKLFGKEHPMYVRALSKEIQMEYALGNYKQASKDFVEVGDININFLTKYFEGLTEKEKNIQSERIKNDFEFYYNLVAKIGTEDPSMVGRAYNYALSSKAMLLSSSIKTRSQIHQSKDTVLIGQYEAWVNKKELLSNSLSMSVSQRAKDSINVEVLEKEIHKLEKEITHKSKTFENQILYNGHYTWQHIKDSLMSNEIAVEIIRCRYFTHRFTDSIFYLSLIVAPTTKSAPELIVMVNGKEMEQKYFSYYRNCVRFDVPDMYSRKIFWEPLKAKIGEGKKIYLSPDGIYNLVNLEGLPGTKPGQNILDEEVIVLVSNTKDIMHSRLTKVSSASHKIELFGNPTYYADNADEKSKIAHTVSPLPGSELEVKEIGNIMNKKGINPDVYVSQDASESKVKALHDPSIFHIATHGFFLNDPNAGDQNRLFLNNSPEKQNPLLRAGLVLSNGGRLFDTRNIYKFNKEDGILTAYEAMNLHFDNTDLVVLSACESATGEVSSGEGVYGLQRAFLVAGAKSIILSLFKVSDSVTEELMTIFYKRWMDTGDKRGAFIYAKKQIREKYNQANYWSIFIMMGV